MGGPGSGNRSLRWNSGATVESCRGIDVRRLQREGYLRPGMRLQWAWWDADTGEQKASIGMIVRGSAGRADRVVLRYRYQWDGEDWQDVTERIPLEWTPCYYGGWRPWISCPSCGRRVAILYGGRYFRCRHCHGLVYASQSEDRMDRMRRKAEKIKRRLNDDPTAVHTFPRKPKHMHWRTYWGLRREVLEAEMAYDEAFIASAAALLDRVRGPGWRN